MVFDKTGTLTKGQFAVKAVYPADGIKKDAVLEAAAGAEADSSHPIAKSVLAAFGRQPGQRSGYEEIPGHGVEATLMDGRKIIAGNAKLMEREGVVFKTLDEPGTVLYVAQDGNFLGSILIADQIKPCLLYTSFVSLDTNFIIGIGPIATTTSYFTPSSICFLSASVTNPEKPKEPSSVVMMRLSPVSYTHLDVYKRQRCRQTSGRSL